MGSSSQNFRVGVPCPNMSKVRVLPQFEHKYMRGQGAGCSWVVSFLLALVGEFESHHHLASGFRGAANTGKEFTPSCYELEKWISEAVSFMFSCKPWRFSVQQATAPFEIPIQVRLKKIIILIN